MTKAELVTAVAQKTGFKKVDADKAVEAVFEVIREELSRGGAVAVTGFGKFAGRERGPKKGSQTSYRFRWRSAPAVAIFETTSWCPPRCCPVPPADLFPGVSWMDGDLRRSEL